jgi:hypothetical protein
MSEATDALLAAYRDDLQRQLGRSATVERLVIRETDGRTTLVAMLRIGSRTYEHIASGTNVVTAYSELIRTTPEPVLSAAYRELLDSLTPSGAAT